MMGWLLLIIPGGIAVPTAVFLLARHLVYRDTDSLYRASVLGQVQVANAETAHRAAVRAELAKHMPTQTRPRPKELSRR